MPKVHDKVTTHIKPDWLKVRIQSGKEFSEVAAIVRKHSLHTICSSGMCPNKAECWNRRTATLMILGDICTRGCRFCATKTGKTLPIDTDEPSMVARSISLMGLKHAVITSVTRDDLHDEGASHWASVVCETKKMNPQTTIELLIPDMHAREELLDLIISSQPDIIGHNIETVERLTPEVRSGASYQTSLNTIKYIDSKGTVAKSGIMLGMGETDPEIMQTLNDLRQAGCKIVTLGQYLRPTMQHWPVYEYIQPKRFDFWRDEAYKLGFSYVASAPLVRSSYLAEEALRFCSNNNAT